MMGHVLTQWFRLYATSRKAAGSRPDEVNDLSVYIFLPAVLGLRVYSASTINEYQKYSRGRRVRLTTCLHR
jgi:hypothetical protein